MHIIQHRKEQQRHVATVDTRLGRRDERDMRRAKTAGRPNTPMLPECLCTAPVELARVYLRFLCEHAGIRRRTKSNA